MEQQINFESYYGVLLGRKNKSREFLAFGEDSAPKLFLKRRDARHYCRALNAAPHNLDGKVIRVGVQYSFLPKP